MFTSSCRVLELLADPASGLAAFLDEIRAQESDVQRRIAGHRAIGEDHGNARGLGFHEHGVPAGCHHRRERDDVHLLRDEGAQRLDLVFLLLLRVGEAQVDVHGGGGGLDGFGVRRAPFALGADLAEAEHDALVLRFAGAARRAAQRPRSEASRVVVRASS